METKDNKIEELTQFISWVAAQEDRLQCGGLDVSVKLEYGYRGTWEITAFVWKGTHIVKSCWGNDLADERQYDKFKEKKASFEKFLSMTTEQINAAYYEQQIVELQKKIAEGGK